MAATLRPPSKPTRQIAPAPTYRPMVVMSDYERTAILLAGSDEWSFRFDYVSMKPGTEKIAWKEGEPFVASPFLLELSEGIVSQAGESVGLD